MKLGQRQFGPPPRWSVGSVCGLTAACALILAGGHFLSRAARSGRAARQATEIGGSVAAGLGFLVAVAVIAWTVRDLTRARRRPAAASPLNPAADPAENQVGTAGSQVALVGSQADSAASAGSAVGTPPCPGPADRTVKILMLGFSGSGKTLMLAGLYNGFHVGGVAGIQFSPDAASNAVLLQLANQIQDAGNQYLPAGTRTAETKKWSFHVMVQLSGRTARAFTLEYLDYPGSCLERYLAAKADDPPDSVFMEELAKADVLMGVLDGAQLKKLLDNGNDMNAVRSIENLLNALARASKPNVHLVISKWDLLHHADGAHYTAGEIVRQLSKLPAFTDFVNNPRYSNLRIMPVSALGMNGFARPENEDDPEGPMVRDATRLWIPRHVRMPFFCAIPDIISSDEKKLAELSSVHRPGPTSLTHKVANITLAVFGLMGVLTVTAGGWALAIPVNQIVARVKKFARDPQRHRTAPVPAEDEAMARVLRTCYTEVAQFEQRWQDFSVDAWM